MGDFAQVGLICTLQRLNDTHLPRLEEELTALSRERPIGLVLPCHGRDLESPAFQHLIDELRGARFLRAIVISVNETSLPTFSALPQRFAGFPARCDFLRNKAARGGKGANVAAAFAHLRERGDCEIFATQDCDVSSFRRVDLTRLCYAVAHPQLGYRFAKMYYSRVSDDRLFGRVSRLFVTPLLRAIGQVAGPLALVDFLLAFRYPLAGEVALTRELATALPARGGWALEIGQLCDVFRHADAGEVCQVDGGTAYEHKHQPATPALARMAAEIAEELFRQLAADGITVDTEFRRAVTDAFGQEAALALRRSQSLALINALPFDQAAERALTKSFAEQFNRPASAW